ncbi:LURP-one-related [Dillenia turbinata]|uniref:LURP-one-related n=1 Tax=Dillenia turbinata TaxID=194707 RepID=A0AAN8V8Y4_9MAGN
MNSQIPIDLFVSKKHRGLTRSGFLKFTDANGNLIFTIDSHSSLSDSPHRTKLLLDASGKPLISICHHQNGTWQAFRGDKNADKDLIFWVKRVSSSLTRIELEVHLVGDGGQDATSKLKVKGCPFQRACTIYKGDSIVAQTSLMYKLGKVYVGRCKFRLTVFPGFEDHAFLAALVVIFLAKKK